MKRKQKTVDFLETATDYVKSANKVLDVQRAEIKWTGERWKVIVHYKG